MKNFIKRIEEVVRGLEDQQAMPDNTSRVAWDQIKTELENPWKPLRDAPRVSKPILTKRVWKDGFTAYHVHSWLDFKDGTPGYWVGGDNISERQLDSEDYELTYCEIPGVNYNVSN